MALSHIKPKMKKKKPTQNKNVFFKILLLTKEKNLIHLARALSVSQS